MKKRIIVCILIICCVCSLIFPASASGSNFILPCENARERYVVKGNIILFNYIMCQYGPTGQYAVFNIYRGTSTIYSNFVESYYAEFDNRTDLTNLYLDVKTKNYSYGTYTIEYYVSWSNVGHYSTPTSARFRTTFEVVASANPLTGLGLVNDDTSERYASGSQLPAVKGESYTFTTYFEPKNTTSTGYLTASSSDPSVAKFEKNIYGELELEILKAGNATLTVACDNVTSTFYVSPKCEHSYQVSAQTGATCTKAGSTTYRCSCGDSYTTPVAALGHNMRNGVCTRCGSTVPFIDVDTSDYYYEPVKWAVANGITTGTSTTRFSPDNACTRAQVVTFLWRAAGSPEPQYTVNPFSDIKEKDYYYKAVLWAVGEGITSGTGKGKFSPDSECTRAQVATFLWRAQGKPAPASASNTFSDVAQGAYYYEAVLWAVEQGITNGTGKGKFSPDNSCTRGQIVTFLYRALA